MTFLTPLSCILTYKRKQNSRKCLNPAILLPALRQLFLPPSPHPKLLFISPLYIFYTAGKTIESRRKISKTIQLCCNKMALPSWTSMFQLFCHLYEDAWGVVPGWTLHPVLGIFMWVGRSSRPRGPSFRSPQQSRIL